MAPTGTDPTQPSSRVYFSYNVAPGATVKDSVTLWNYSNVELTFEIYPTDAFNNATGDFDVFPGSKPPTDIGTWVKLPQAAITAPAHSKIDLPFTMTVPPGTRPGDHIGAILAANQATGTTQNGKAVNLDRRTGTRMYVRVSGPLQPALAVENVDTTYHPRLNPLGGSLNVTYTVRNAGNVRLAAHQTLVASGPFGMAAKKAIAKDVPELLPGNAVTLHAHFDSVPALIRANAAIKLQPFSPDPDITSVPRIDRGGHTWAIPWSIVALIVMIWLGRRFYQALQKRRRERAALTSPPAGKPMAPVP